MKTIDRSLLTVNNLPSLIAWLQTKPPSEEYIYHDICGCALAQFAQTQVPGAKVGSCSWFIPDDQEDLNIVDSDINILSRLEPTTFGGMLNRSLKLQEELNANK